MSQNNGMCMPTVDGEMYYRKLTQIIEVEYYNRTKYVLFLSVIGLIAQETGDTRSTCMA
jgi:hypothetical protein